jgi:alpha-ketoglutarate-dependent taurine dioxygenase
MPAPSDAYVRLLTCLRSAHAGHGDLGTYRQSWDSAACNPTLLHALAVPERGHGVLRWGGGELPYTAGSTLFVRGGALLEALPSELAARCRRIRVRYRTNVLGAQVGHVQASPSGVRSLPEAEPPPEGWRLGAPQPIVWVHPETQAESLQVSASTYGVFEESMLPGCGAGAAATGHGQEEEEGEEAPGTWTRMSRAQSSALLEEIFGYGLTPQNALCVDYAVGTTVIWDNRLVLHRSTPQEDYLAAGQERLMHRVFVVDASEQQQQQQQQQQAAKL